MYNSSTGYNSTKKEIGTLLRGHGFTRYKTSFYYRVTAGEMLQFINFQKGDQSLNDQMTINIVIQPLFCPGCSFNILQPGGRIGNLLDSAKDVWWKCDTEQSTITSIESIGKAINEKLIPFFNSLATAEQLWASFNDPDSRFLWRSATTFIDQGYICLKAKQYHQALSIFQANKPSKVAKFKTIKRLIEEEAFTEIEEILLNNVHYQKEKLGI